MQPQNQEFQPEKSPASNNPGQDPIIFSSDAQSPESKPEHRKSSRVWAIFFILLALANIVTVIFPVVVFWGLAQQAKAGMSGTEFIGLALGPLVLAGPFVAILNVIILALFLIKKRPRRKAVIIISGLIILVSVMYAGRVGYSNYREVQLSREANRSLSKDEALSLINSCKVERISRQDRIVFLMKLDPSAQDEHVYMRYFEDKYFNDIQAAAKAVSKSCGEIVIIDARDRLDH